MIGEARRLTIYCGERDRSGERFLADRLLDVFEQERIEIGVLLRGAEGFGAKHHLRTDRLLTLSEDLPVTAEAVDRPERIERVLAALAGQRFDGLVTVERAWSPGSDASPEIPARLGDEVKLTVYLGRGARVDGRPAYERAVEILHDHGVAGATALVGVDGTVAGARRRGRFFSRNLGVPAVVLSVGRRDPIATALAELRALPGEPTAILERVRSLKRDGETLAGIGNVPGADERGLSRWIKLTLYSSEGNVHGGRPVHIAAVRALRVADAPGATALRGVWGYHGDHDPHGDSFWSIRRRVPTITTVVDLPERAGRWLEILDAATPQRGLITAEVVPAFRATGPGFSVGGLEVADAIDR